MVETAVPLIVKVVVVVVAVVGVVVAAVVVAVIIVVIVALIVIMIIIIGFILQSDLSPRQPALIPGVLFGEAVLRNCQGLSNMCGRSKSEDYRFSAKEFAPLPPPAPSLQVLSCCAGQT